MATRSGNAGGFVVQFPTVSAVFTERGARAPPGDADGAVGQDAPFDFGGGLLGADEDDAEGAAALGDVEEDLLDGAVAVAGGVLVELVEDDEHQRPGGALAFFSEHRLPLSSRRVDAILAGEHPRTGAPSYVIVELKQWSQADLFEDDPKLVLIDGYGRHPRIHPVEQVRDSVST